jgi:hypothetical protein
MGASNSSSVVVSKPAAPTVSGFHVKISFDGEDVLNKEGEMSFFALTSRNVFTSHGVLWKSFRWNTGGSHSAGL